MARKPPPAEVSFRRLPGRNVGSGGVGFVIERRMGQALAEAPLAEALTIAFGDLFLADIRVYREERLSRVGKQAIFPLWGRDTNAWAREFVAAGFEAVLVCVDPRRLDPSSAGRRFDAELLADLPPDVDPCGENGEFQSWPPGRAAGPRSGRGSGWRSGADCGSCAKIQ